MIADDLEQAATVQLANIVLAAGYDEGSIWFEVSNDNGVTTGELRNGDTRREIGQGDPQQPAIAVLSTGEIMASIARGGSIVSFLSADWGEEWTALDQVG